MIEDIRTRPTNPKNGSRFKNKEGEEFIFRYGSWIKQEMVKPKPEWEKIQ